MDRYIICPDTETCPIYKIWEEQVDNRLDIIRYQHHAKPEGENYSCLALEAVKNAAIRDAGTGPTTENEKIELSEEFMKKFKERFTKVKGLGGLDGAEPSECVKIVTLNLLLKK